MKFKLDENLGRRCAQLFVEAGHDCSTVLSQGLSGSSDSALIVHCRAEGRALVTLDTLILLTPCCSNPPRTEESQYYVREALHPRMN